ncbi:MAG: polysaccharide deacetylase family protein [Myxococcales bacterium]|nr:polysaccharide deacetylase family protein [Myxococcales bacterium]
MATVRLTFDNGPHPVGTPRVLDVLAKHDLAATFFVLGKHLATPGGRALAERVRDEGHRLGNHSYSHAVPLGLDRGADAVERELGRTHELLASIWHGPRWFRPFGGGGRLGPHLLSPAAVRWLVEHQHTCVLWNVVPGDWQDPEGWSARALHELGGHDDVVIVLHDSEPEAMQGLEYFVTRALDQGHAFDVGFPPSCTPIVAGIPGPDLGRYVAIQ